MPSKRDLILCALLALSTAAVYEQTSSFDFVAWDDQDYVTENFWIRDGLTRDGLVWSLTTGHAGNWHPLTWLSHMLDCELFGLDPGGHHLTSLLLHVANALLLFGLFRYMTGSAWRSALVAALFALHPLHVESVAWVSERKDVLSTCFGFGALWAYAAYAARGGAVRYLSVAVLLALGLMAKPTLVTLPFLLLLLDYWPLCRTSFGPPDPAGGGLGCAQRSTSRLVLEKAPLLALSAVSSVVTLLAQRGAMTATEHVALGSRLANALVSYARYIGKALWPSDLSPFYPYPGLHGGEPWAAWQVGGAALLLLALSVWLVGLARRRYATVGWLWFLGALVPMIGIVQVGTQAMADRYTYLSLVGLFIVVAWGAGDLVARWPARGVLLRRIAAGGAALALAACAAASLAQAQHWRSGRALHELALRRSPSSATIHTNLGYVLRNEGEVVRAMVHFRRAIEIDSDYWWAHTELGNALRAQGRLAAAIDSYRRALRARPDELETLMQLALALAATGRVDEAIAYHERALRLGPDVPGPANNLAWTLATHPASSVADGERAVGLAKRACALTRYQDSRNLDTLAAAHAAAGQFAEAVRVAERASDLGAATGDPEVAEYRRRLGLYLQRRPYRAAVQPAG
jgi:tetratricopeptide (TPR) repeat protein